MSKGGGSQTVTQNVDPGTAAYVSQMRRLALGYAGAPGYGATPGSPSSGGGLPPWAGGLAGIGANALGLWPGGGGGSTGGQGGLQPINTPLPAGVQQAVSQYGGYANAGQQGLAALTGGPNPFLNTYLSQMDPFFAQQRARAVGSANDQATLAGAFGGTGSQVGAAQAGNLADQTQAQFNYQAFNDAQQRALQAAQMGYGATGLAAFLPQQYQQGQLNLLGSAIGPQGTVQQQQMQQDPWSQVLGTGLTIASLFA